MMLLTSTFLFGFVLNQVSHLYATALRYGSLAPRPTSLQLYGSTALRLYGSTSLRLYVSTALRLYGSTALRLYGSTALQLYGSTPLCLYDSTLIPTPANELQDMLGSPVGKHC